MARKVFTLLMLAAALPAAAGCSRTYDGTVVPTYQMTVKRYAGIPILAMRRTPLGEPRAELEAQAALTTFPPPPSPPADVSPVARAAPAATPRIRRPAIRWTAAPRIASAERLPGKQLVCRNEQSADRAVSVVCE